jgi:hypothetical protein
MQNTGARFLRKVHTMKLLFIGCSLNHTDAVAKNFVMALLKVDPKERPTADEALRLPV